MTQVELLRLLEESQELLNQATRTEELKRQRSRATSLEDELEKCAQTAEDGYREASEHLQAIQEIIGKAAEGAEALRTAATGNGRRAEDSFIHRSPVKAVENISEAHQTSLREIQANRERLGTFNITLFGRTMTGKSTLMEILTRGNGGSIGKGAQRTTREVREYEWNGLRILDVPGVAAFDGAPDEETAYGAAHQADLIAFLISDDAPQETEAEHLARLRGLGVPILGICNVKMSVESRVQVKRFIRDQEKMFDQERLNRIVDQFNQLADNHGAGQHVEFKHAHLRSRFLAGLEEYRNQQTELEDASRFGDIEDHICNEIFENGRFHRRRNFLESVSRASFNTWKTMLEAAGTAYKLHDRIGDHVRETGTWRKQFRRNANSRIQKLVDETIGRLRNEVTVFVEQNCENPQIATRWKQKVEQAGINRRVQELQRELQQQTVRKVKTLTEEMDQELELLSPELEIPDVTAGRFSNYRRIWDRGTLGISSALGIAAAAAIVTFPPLAPPLGIAAAVVGVIGTILRGLFGNKDKKRREAISRISPELYRSLDQLESSIRTGFRKWLNESLMEQQVNRTIGQLEGAAVSTGEAARFFRTQAGSLNQRQLQLNRSLLENALEKVNENTALPNHAVVARVPGQLMVIRTIGPIEEETVQKIQSLLQEEISTIPANWSPERIVRWATGGKSTSEAMTVDNQRDTAHDKNDRATLTRMDIARQLTGLEL